MAKVSRRSKKTIVDDEIGDKTASASESTSIVLKSKRKRKSPPQNAPPQRSSSYRGVTRHRWTGRYEAHLWDKNSWNETQTKKGRQVYLGAYFDELFSISEPHDFDEALAEIKMVITGEVNAYLTVPVTEQEVKAALFMMHPDKAPGPDGMTALFYQKA